MSQPPHPVHPAETRDTVIARLIANTRRRSRPDNLVQIARWIRWLEHDLGGLNAVSSTIGLSTGMLQRFLSVERLCPEVQQLVQGRKIDIINVVYYISSLGTEAQKTIAQEVLAGRLTAEDVRVLAPLMRSLPELALNRLISRVRESRDVKLYVAYFHVPAGSVGADRLRSRFESLVGRSEIVSLTIEDEIGSLELTRLGHEKLRQAARGRGVPLRRLVDSLVLASRNQR